MKNFILGCLFILLTAAGTASIMTVKPATPKSVIVYDGYDPKPFILKYSKFGYIISKTHVHNNVTFIVMEKY